MVIQIDTREKARAIKKIQQYFDETGVKTISSKLYVGDYMNLENPRIVVDRKQNLLELTSNVCQDHRRFILEIKNANAVGIKIVFLVEHSANIKELDDVQYWVNPRLKTSPMAVSGERLYKILSTIKTHYNVDFCFCTKAETGREIVRLLGGGNNG